MAYEVNLHFFGSIFMYSEFVLCGIVTCVALLYVRNFVGHLNFVC